MSKNTFQLKQFSIEQGRSAMKLGTDALILGAWVASMELNPQHILDIGAGTGILSLMLAQAYPDAYIEAIELDEGASLDAKQNFASSPWARHLQVHQGNALAFHPRKKYDLIISNPPFFASTGISAAKQERQLARQESEQGLGIESLISRASSWLKPGGRLCIVSPYDREEELRIAATTALLYLEEMCVFYSQVHSPVRLLSCLRPLSSSQGYTACRHTQLLQREEAGNYSPKYRELLSPYLLEHALL